MLYSKEFVGLSPKIRFSVKLTNLEHLLLPENGDCKFLQNVCAHLLDGIPCHNLETRGLNLHCCM
jgi:hypothetical protein